MAKGQFEKAIGKLVEKAKKLEPGNYFYEYKVIWQSPFQAVIQVDVNEDN